MSKKVYIFLADGFEDIEGLTVVDLMRRAGIDIETVSIKESNEITTSHGIMMKTDRVFTGTDFSDADMLVLPGGMPGTKYLGEYQPLCDLLRDFYGKSGKVGQSVRHRLFWHLLDSLKEERQLHIRPAWRGLPAQSRLMRVL